MTTTSRRSPATPPRKPDKKAGKGTKEAKGPSKAQPSREPETRRRWRGLAPETRDAQRRARLLEAGLEAFAGKGYGASSVASVCALAGVSTRDFYEFYGTREDLLVDLYDTIIQEVAAAMNQELRSQPASLDEMVAVGVGASLRAMVEDERKARINCTEVVGVSRRVEEHRRRGLITIRQAYEPHLSRLREAGQLPDRDLSFAVVGAIGAFNEMLGAWMELPERPPLEWLAGEIGAVTRAALSSHL